MTTPKREAGLSAIHIIERRRDGYAPQLSEVQVVLRKAALQGFRTDWTYCGVLEDDSLSFCPGDGGMNLIAVKRRNKRWKFMTEREYLDAGRG